MSYPNTTTEFTSDPVKAADLTESERHSLLASERRRLLLDILEAQTTPIDLMDIASEVAEQEAGLNAEDTETVKRVEISLHHVHLPKMDEFGVLTYNIDSNQVRP